MKKFKALYIASLALGAAALASCDNDWEQPPMIVPSFPEGLQANMTIQDLKAQYWQQAESYGTEIGLTAEGDSIIIMGTVVNSDKNGNFSKTLIVQDATGAITFAVDQSKLYQQFPDGCGIAVNMTGLTFGRYSGQEQTGAMVDGTVNRIELAEFQPHTWLDPLKGKTEISEISLADIKAMNPSDVAAQPEVVKWESRLVRISGVHFQQPGEQYAPGSDKTLVIEDADGNRLDVRTSSYADFAWDYAPEGTGTIVGYLMLYRSQWQLKLRSVSEEDMSGFTPYVPPTYLLNATFNGGDLAGFTVDNVDLGGVEAVWTGSSRYNCAVATGYVDRVNHATDSWLVSPAFEVQGGAVLSFDHAINYFNGSDYRTQATLAVRETGAEEWTAVEIPNYGTNSDFNFVSSGEISLDAYAGKNVQVGFHYTSTAAKAGTWEVKNVKVIVK